MFRKKTLRLYCFSPPVMMATFIIEVSFAAYVLWRYQLTTLSRLIVAILGCLAVFQGTEFLLCGGSASQTGVWARLGYASITLLPPLGIHLIYRIANQPITAITKGCYVLAAVFIAYYTFGMHELSSHMCYANYAAFSVSPTSMIFFSLYYYGLLFFGITLALRWAAKVSKKQKTALLALALGYTSFILPTAVVNSIDPSTLAGIPSIMCGFAVILAFLLVRKVAPAVLSEKPAAVPKLRFPF